MKFPRDLDAAQLIKLLKQLGYTFSRQKGSHIRLITLMNGEHQITIPNHSPIKIGTLSSIISDIANHFGKTKEEIANILFS